MRDDARLACVFCVSAGPFSACWRDLRACGISLLAFFACCRFLCISDLAVSCVCKTWEAATYAWIFVFLVFVEYAAPADHFDIDCML